jgi:hypothetical protein
MNRKYLSYFLVLLIVAQTSFQGCASVSNNIREKHDLFFAENLGACKLIDIKKGDHVKLILDDWSIFKGEIVWIKSGTSFTIKHINQTNYAERTEILWSRISASEKLNVTSTKKINGIPLAIGLGIVLVTIYLIQYGRGMEAVVNSGS